MRDNAKRFDEANCAILGASFDTPAENLEFAEAQGFDYPLLCDVDRSVGAQYEVVRGADEQYVDYPKRHSFLIDESGVIRQIYAVTDVAAHATAVLADLETLQQ